MEKFRDQEISQVGALSENIMRSTSWYVLGNRLAHCVCVAGLESLVLRKRES
jgi:hypothetical protein